MKITESRLRRLIRQVIRESTGQDDNPYHDARMSAAKAGEVGDDVRDFTGQDDGYDAASNTYLDTTSPDAMAASYNEDGFAYDEEDGFINAEFPPGENLDPDSDLDLDPDSDPYIY